MAEDVRREDVIQHAEGAETGLDANVVLPQTKPNVIPTGSMLPSTSPTVPSADAAGGPQ